MNLLNYVRKIVLVMSLTLVPGTVAVQDADVFCGTLSVEDCSILAQSQRAIAELSAASMTFDLELKVMDIPNIPDKSIALDGSGLYNIDREVLQSSTTTMTPEATAEVDTTATDVQQELLRVLERYDAALTVNATLRRELPTQTGAPVDTSTFDLRLVDGVGYLNLDELSRGIQINIGAATDSPTSDQAGWGAVDFVDLVNILLEQSPKSLSNLVNASWVSFVSHATTATLEPALIEQFSQYFTVTRDADVDGMRVFTTDIDFGGLISDPAFQISMRQSMEARWQVLDDVEFDRMRFIFNLLGDDFSLLSTSYIDPVTGYVQRQDINISLDISTALTEVGLSLTDEPPIITLTGSVYYTDFNLATVTAPADAKLLPTELVLRNIACGPPDIRGWYCVPIPFTFASLLQ